MSSTRPPAEHAARRGVPLWLYLTALVLVPLLGVAGLTGVMVRSVVVDADSAARAAAAGPLGKSGYGDYLLGLLDDR